MIDRVDVLVVGGGAAGLSAARAARQRGARVCLVEREPLLGGDCTHYGCVPSKTLVEIARSVHASRLLARDGLLTATGQVVFDACMRRVAHVRADIAIDESDQRLAEAGIDVLHDEARLLSPGLVAVGEQRIAAKAVVLATGTQPRVPNITGLAGSPYLTNRTVFGLDAAPTRLAILGGGATGLELAQAFSRLGVSVTLLEQRPSLLADEEPEASAGMLHTLSRDSVQVLTNATVTSIAHHHGAFRIVTTEHELRCDALLVAAGRRPGTERLGLDAVGIDVEDGYIRVDARCRTSIRGVYAAGDVTGGAAFTHTAVHEGSVAGRNAAGGRARRDERVVPRVTYTDPELARVGMLEQRARVCYTDIRTVTLPLTSVDRARICGDTIGFVKLVTRRDPLIGYAAGGRLVGVTILAPQAGEVIHECALALRTGLHTGRLAQLIHAYPTISIAVQQAAAQLFPLGRALAPLARPAGSHSTDA